MKKTFIWTQEYSVHVAEIDEQHKQFISICNDLVELSQSESFTNEEALKRVSRLGDYAFYHLAFEEELFVKTQYPDGQSHTAIHDAFREKAKKVINEARKETIDREVLKDIAEFVVNWLMGHILHTDKKYSDYFNQHGIR